MRKLPTPTQSVGPHPATRAEAEAREQIAAADRKGWFPAPHASQGFGILARDGREVCRCYNEMDRDEILRIARAHDAMVTALTEIATHDYTQVRVYETDTYLDEYVSIARAALALARGTEKE